MWRSRPTGTRPRFGTARSAVGLSLAGLLLLAACSDTGQQDTEQQSEPIEREVNVVETPAPRIDDPEVRLPVQLQGLEVVDPGWDTPAQQLDGIFVGAGEHGDRLLFSAIDSEGVIRWEVERPASCIGFTLARTSEDQTIAVLSDQHEGDDGLAEFSASAYDLHTGGRLWGPVEVPGPHQGPGLVYAEPSAEPMGATGPRVALDADTGEPVLDETEEQQVIGEYHGTAVISDGPDLVAVSTRDGDELWRQDGEAEPTPRAVPGIEPGPGIALLAQDEHPPTLIDVTDGQIIAEDVHDVSTDMSTGTRVVQVGEQLHGYDPDGEQIWNRAAAPESTIRGVGGVIGYVQEGSGLRAINALTGETAVGFDEGDADLAVPEALAAQGSGVVLTADGSLLVTNVVTGEGQGP